MEAGMAAMGTNTSKEHEKAFELNLPLPLKKRYCAERYDSAKNLDISNARNIRLRS